MIVSFRVMIVLVIVVVGAAFAAGAVFIVVVLSFVRLFRLFGVLRELLLSSCVFLRLLRKTAQSG